MKRKRVSTSSAENIVPPLPAQLSWDQRDLIARVALAYRADGHSWEQTLTFLQRVHPGLQERSVRRWATDLLQKGHVFALEKNSGRPRVVQEEKLRLLVGWILYETDSGEIIKLDDATIKANDDFDMDVVKETIRLWLHEYGIETRPTGCTTANKATPEEKVRAVQDFIKELRPQLKANTVLCSLDFTYTSHRTARPQSLAGRGRKSAARKKISRFTNCLVTALLSNGVQLDSILYTLNSDFRTDRKKTKVRVAKEMKFSLALAKYGISEDRTLYDGKLKGEKGTFAKEYSDMIRDFLEYHKDKLDGLDVIFLSDNGNAFKDGEESIIEKLGYGKHIFYPACVHQYLSPNDNRLHGVAKAVWRSMFKEFSDDVQCSLALMKCLDDVPEDTIRGWFRRNLFLDGGIVRDEDVKELISGHPSKWSDLHDACINEYKEWAGIEEPLSAEARRLSTTLDGEYYA